MKTLIVILIIASFLQTTVLPIDLVLLILICRAYIKPDRANLYLGFTFGVLTAHLNLGLIGIQCLIYLIAIEVTETLAKQQFAGNPLLIVPISLVFLSFNQFANLLLGYSSFDYSKVILASFLSLPILFLIRLWEERFIVRKEIRLKF